MTQIETKKQQSETFERTFTKVELQQIKDVKEFMKDAFDASTWNHLREQAKELWSEKIISAVDGLRKWLLQYDKPSRKHVCLGIKF